MTRARSAGGKRAAEHAGAAASLVVLAIAAKAILGRVGTFDLGFDDECYMLWIGIGLPTRPLPTADYSVLYMVWYRSIGGAARENPSAFAWHVGRNARLLPDRLAWFAEVDGYLPPALKVALAWGAGSALVAGAFALARRRRRVSPRLLAWLPLWMPVGASFAAAVLLIRPRDHYLVPFCYFASATLASACGALARRPSRHASFVSTAGLAAAIALLALLPTYARGALPSLAEARGRPPPRDWDGRNTVEALRALGLRGERVILEPEFSRAVYAGIPFRWIPKSGKDRPFSDFLRQHDVDVVIASPSLLDDARFRDDPEFRSFLADDGDHRGFVLTRVPRSRTIIAVRPK